MPAFAYILLPYTIAFFSIELVTRLSLMARSMASLDWPVSMVAITLIKGAWFDVVTASLVLLPILFVITIPHASAWARPLGRWGQRLLLGIFIYIMLFSATAEHLFWSEFTTRFNFIAVDYLVYTQEVIGNIVESYNLPLLLAGIAAATVVFVSVLEFGLRNIIRTGLHTASPMRLRIRLLCFVAACLFATTLTTISDADQAQGAGLHTEAVEIAGNGIYSLFSAFRNNEIDYNRFYATRPEAEVKAEQRTLLAEHEAPYENANDMTRVVTYSGRERKANVVIVVMESMSGNFMTRFGNKSNLTPELEKLADAGLFFSNLYATGTRTVRGLEAVTLSVPPTPGQSILRRPHNDNLFSLGFVFKDRGYTTQFIYGGYGYFDNMNAFFESNGFDIIDRTAFKKDEYGFANVWGIADEYVFDRAIREGDAQFAAKKPFMQVIMTTSNHRPYTFPASFARTDIKGRQAGVAYADYSAGYLIAQARKKPWFDNTIFVFVADHTAGAGGKFDLDPQKYHIPMIFYAPKFIKPQTYDKLASQIDMAPTLLGLLRFDYLSKFYGEDLLNDSDETPHAFISTYQKMGLIKDGTLTVLLPKKGIEQQTWPEQTPLEPKNQQRINEAISYYQSASWWRETQGRIPTLIPATKP